MTDPSDRLRWLIYGTEDWISDLAIPTEQNITTYLRLLLP